MVTLKQFIVAKKIRSQFGKGDRLRDKDLTTPQEIQRYDNILYSNDRKYKKWQLLDVYRPKSAKNNGKLEKLPVIVSVHGGAWVYGTKEVYQYYCMNLAKKGFAVVNFSYRLAPEVKFPASLQDTDSVFNWICSNADEYGFDTQNVFAVGDSAGGHLLSLYAQALTNQDFIKTFPFMQPKEMTLRALALNCGKYTMNDEDPSFKLLLSALMKNGGTKEEIDMIDATAHITKDFPPAFIMSCKGDYLLPQSMVIKNALDSAGVKNEYHIYGTDEKPLWHVFHCDCRLKEAEICNEEECNFFRSFL